MIDVKKRDRTVSRPAKALQKAATDGGSKSSGQQHGAAGTSSTTTVFVPGSRIMYGSWIALEHASGKFLCVHRRGPKLHGKLGSDSSVCPWGGDAVCALS